MTARAARLPPATNIDDARQRWLFRMVHSRRPLQEKMALFWHNHFATAYSKIAGAIGAAEATRMMAAKPSEDPRGVEGQLELFREHRARQLPRPAGRGGEGSGDARLARRPHQLEAQPQENFARELMELFTMGVGKYTGDGRLRRRARVHRLEPAASRRATRAYYDVHLQRRPARHRRPRSSRSRSTERRHGRFRRGRPPSGMQDGIDLIDACARHPATGPRLARKLYAYFVNEVDPPDEALIDEHGADLLRAAASRSSRCCAGCCMSPQFRDPSNYFKRYSWPVEFVVRAIKEVGWAGFSVERRADAADHHGAAAVRAARRQRLGPRAAAGSRAARCWRA